MQINYFKNAIFKTLYFFTKKFNFKFNLNWQRLRYFLLDLVKGFKQ